MAETLGAEVSLGGAATGWLGAGFGAGSSTFGGSGTGVGGVTASAGSLTGGTTGALGFDREAAILESRGA